VEALAGAAAEMGLQERGHKEAEERGDDGDDPRELLERASEALQRGVFPDPVLQGRDGIWGEAAVPKGADVPGDARGGAGGGQGGSEGVGCGGAARAATGAATPSCRACGRSSRGT